MSERAGQLDQVRVDGDDLSDVLVEVEASFGATLPHDLVHVGTVGELFDEVLKVRKPDGLGDRCDTAMAFYRLRRILKGYGLSARAGPTTALAGQGLPSPRTIRRILSGDLRFAAPGIVISRTGCILSSIIVASAIGLALVTWSWDWLPLWLLVLPALALDRGGWEGDWKTLGSLSRAIAARNVATLVRDGARNRESDWWRSFARLIAETAFDERGQAVDYRQIGRATKFVFT